VNWRCVAGSLGKLDGRGLTRRDWGPRAQTAVSNAACCEFALRLTLRPCSQAALCARKRGCSHPRRGHTRHRTLCAVQVTWAFNKGSIKQAARRR
jgi:hypothetical protein